MLAIAIIVGLVCLLAGAGAGYIARRRSVGTELQQAEEQASRILVEAESRQKELLLEAKEETLRLRTTLEAEVRERRAESHASNNASPKRKRTSTERPRRSNAATRASEIARRTSRSSAPKPKGCALARRRD